MRSGRRTGDVRCGALALALVLAAVLVSTLDAPTARAQAAPAEAPAEPPAGPPAEPPTATPAEPPAEPPSAQAGASAPAEVADSAPTAPAAPTGPSRVALLQAEVTRVEREQPSLVLPWLAAGLGVATLVAGTVVGVINVSTCDGSCSTGAVWPWLVIAGCTFTSAGSAWLLVSMHDESEARHRLERARRELERDRVDRTPRAATSPAFTLRAAF